MSEDVEARARELLLEAHSVPSISRAAVMRAKVGEPTPYGIALRAIAAAIEQGRSEVPDDPTETMILNALSPGGHSYPVRLSRDDVVACWRAMMTAWRIQTAAALSPERTDAE